MQNEIDINEVATSVINTQIENFFEYFSNKGEKLTGELKIQWRQKFKTYENLMREKYSKSRSFFLEKTLLIYINSMFLLVFIVMTLK